MISKKKMKDLDKMVAKSWNKIQKETAVPIDYRYEGQLVPPGWSGTVRLNDANLRTNINSTFQTTIRYFIGSFGDQYHFSYHALPLTQSYSISIFENNFDARTRAQINIVITDFELSREQNTTIFIKTKIIEGLRQLEDIINRRDQPDLFNPPGMVVTDVNHQEGTVTVSDENPYEVRIGYVDQQLNLNNVLQQVRVDSLINGSSMVRMTWDEEASNISLSPGQIVVPRNAFNRIIERNDDEEDS